MFAKFVDVKKTLPVLLVRSQLRAWKRTWIRVFLVFQPFWFLSRRSQVLLPRRRDRFHQICNRCPQRRRIPWPQAGNKKENTWISKYIMLYFENPYGLRLHIIQENIKYKKILNMSNLLKFGTILQKQCKQFATVGKMWSFLANFDRTIVNILAKSRLSFCGKFEFGAVQVRKYCTFQTCR